MPYSNNSYQQYNQQNVFSTGNSNRGYISAPSPSNLLVNQSQASNSSCDSQNKRNNLQHVKIGGIKNTSYNELCFPKTSNYGSMRKKKKKQQSQTNNVGVDCRLNYAVPTSINTRQIEEGIYAYDQENSVFHSNLWWMRENILPKQCEIKARKRKNLRDDMFNNVFFMTRL